MSPQPTEHKRPTTHAKQFTKAELSRMFSAREERVPDAEIARRFGISIRKLSDLIGRKRVET